MAEKISDGLNIVRHSESVKVFDSQNKLTSSIGMDQELVKCL